MNKYITALILFFCSINLNVIPLPKAGNVYVLQADDNLNDILKHGNVILDFFAPWCNPCKQMDGVLTTLAKEFPTILFVKINTEDFDDLATEYKVKSIPAFMFIKDGSRKSYQGSRSIGDFRKLIKSTYQLN